MIQQLRCKCSRVHHCQASPPHGPSTSQCQRYVTMDGRVLCWVRVWPAEPAMASGCNKRIPQSPPGGSVQGLPMAAAAAGSAAAAVHSHWCNWFNQRSPPIVNGQLMPGSVQHLASLLSVPTAQPSLYIHTHNPNVQALQPAGIAPLLRSVLCLNGCWSCTRCLVVALTLT